MCVKYRRNAVRTPLVTRIGGSRDLNNQSARAEGYDRRDRGRTKGDGAHPAGYGRGQVEPAE
jgi:hypothetical protein